MKERKEVRGTILDVINRRIYNGRLTIREGRIEAIEETNDVPKQFILPGFVDAHVHIESSMLVPSEFARLAVRHGTVATVSDPHEIANVCGLAGVEFMIENGEKVPFKFYFGAPSCVPATPFETAGGRLDLQDVAGLLDRAEIRYLSEMMNWPGVLSGDEEAISKIRAAHDRGKPVDGHAPGLKGSRAAAYAAAGITTDHECFTREEAIDKLENGMKILIREGSAARNFDELIPLLGEYPGRIMFCTDDKHPDDLIRGHINELAARALVRGFELFDLLHACSVAPVEHYGLDVGLLRKGDPADLVVVSDPETMHVLQTWINGVCLYDRGEVFLPEVSVDPINRFVSREIHLPDLLLPARTDRVPVIEARDGEIVTGGSMELLPQRDGYLLPDIERDILKITVVNRYEKVPPSVGFVRNFGIRNGAIASSVAHDSHNIIAVGSNDEEICRAVNLLMETRGGISAVSGEEEKVLPLPVAGLMSDRPGVQVALAYEELNRMAAKMGSDLQSPFMLISFMALLVIPEYKISDKGMFDGRNFRFL